MKNIITLNGKKWVSIIATRNRQTAHFNQKEMKKKYGNARLKETKDFDGSYWYVIYVPQKQKQK